MTTTTGVLEPGKQIPNWVVKDPAGEARTLWDYRQKSHLAVIYDPQARPETVARWQAAIRADQKQWDWLNVSFVIAAEGPADLPPGVYAIDRYGIFLSKLPVSKWSFDELEKEFMYYEAKHC